MSDTAPDALDVHHGGIPVAPWEQLLPRMAWRQGEHVALVGPTGRGKTTLALSLLWLRKWVTIFGTKPADSTLEAMTRLGYKKIRAWPPPSDENRRVILWPRWITPADNARQRQAITTALASIWRQGRWCLFVDDVQYLDKTLGLGRELQALWVQARALDVSLVAGTQRPRHVPLEMWSQSTHFFIWKATDADDLRRIAGIGGVDPDIIRGAVRSLEGVHDCVYVNARTEAVAITRAPRVPSQPVISDKETQP